MVAWTWRYGDNGFCADAVVETEVLVFWFSIRLICYTDNPSGDMSCVLWGSYGAVKRRDTKKKWWNSDELYIIYVYVWQQRMGSSLASLLVLPITEAVFGCYIYIYMTTKNYYTPHEPNNHQSLEGHHRSISNTLIEWAWKTTQLRMGWCAKLCRSKMAKRLAWITTEIGLDVFWDSNYIFRFLFYIYWLVVIVF